MRDQYSPAHRKLLDQTVAEIAETMAAADITLADYLKLVQLSDEAQSESSELVRAGWKSECKRDG